MKLMFCITFSHLELVIFPISIVKIHIIHFNLFGSLVLNLIMGVEAHYNGQKMLSSNIVFQICASFNFHQANKRGFHK
jgi:hypothetical protein